MRNLLNHQLHTSDGYTIDEDALDQIRLTRRQWQALDDHIIDGRLKPTYRWIDSRQRWVPGQPDVTLLARLGGALGAPGSGRVLTVGSRFEDLHALAYLSGDTLLGYTLRQHDPYQAVTDAVSERLGEPVARRKVKEQLLGWATRLGRFDVDDLPVAQAIPHLFPVADNWLTCKGDPWADIKFTAGQRFTSLGVALRDVTMCDNWLGAGFDKYHARVRATDDVDELLADLKKVLRRHLDGYGMTVTATVSDRADGANPTDSLTVWL